MKFYLNRHRCPTSIFLGLSAALLAAGLPGALVAGDLPKRKVGLWEINMQIDGMPNIGAIRQCIDANTDNLLQQRGKSECSTMDIKASGSQVTIHAICKMEGSTATTDGVFNGSLDSSYQGTTKTRFTPPFRGVSESNMRQEARWIGPCKPGQKPGDVIMPDIGGIDINQLMNDPKIKELMKRQK